MAIRFVCPVCKTPYTVNDRDAGKKSDCKVCGQRLQVPASERKQTVLGEPIAAAEPSAASTHGPPADHQAVDASQILANDVQSRFPDWSPEKAGRPLSPTLKMGLLAGGIVGGALIVFVFVIVVVASSAKTDQRTAHEQAPKDLPKSFADKPISAGSKSDDVSYILGHRWWSRTPTREQLDAVVRFVIETRRDDEVFVDATGAYYSSRHHYYGELITGGTTDGFHRDRHLSISCKWPTRPDRDAVLQTLRELLDVREYKDGPAGIHGSVPLGQASMPSDEAIRKVPAIRVTAVELNAAYRDDAKRADALYKGKVLEVTGKVANVFRLGFGKGKVSLIAGGNKQIAFDFHRAPDRDLAKVREGTPLIIRGRFAWAVTTSFGAWDDVVETVHLNDCQILDRPGNAAAIKLPPQPEPKVYDSGKALLADMPKTAFPDGDAIELAATEKWCRENLIGREIEWTAKVTKFEVDGTDPFRVHLWTDTQPVLCGGAGLILGEPFLLGKTKCGIFISAIEMSLGNDGRMFQIGTELVIQYERCTANEAKGLRELRGKVVTFHSRIGPRYSFDSGVEVKARDKARLPGIESPFDAQDLDLLPIRAYITIPSVNGFLPAAAKKRDE